MNKILHIFEYVKQCYNSRWNASYVLYVMATHTITRYYYYTCRGSVLDCPMQILVVKCGV